MIRKLQFGDIFDVSKKMKKKYPNRFDFQYGFIVVEQPVMTGGGTGHGPGDIYPDGHNIRFVPLSKSQSTALRPSKKDRWRKPTVVIDRTKATSSFQSGGFTDMLWPDDVILLGWATPKETTKVSTYKKNGETEHMTTYEPTTVKNTITFARCGWFVDKERFESARLGVKSKRS